MEAAGLLELALRFAAQRQQIERRGVRREKSKCIEMRAAHTAFFNDDFDFLRRKSQRKLRVARRVATIKHRPFVQAEAAKKLGARRRFFQQPRDVRRRFAPRCRKVSRVEPRIVFVTRVLATGKHFAARAVFQNDAGAGAPLFQLRRTKRIIFPQKIEHRVFFTARLPFAMRFCNRRDTLSMRFRQFSPLIFLKKLHRIAPREYSRRPVFCRQISYSIGAAKTLRVLATNESDYRVSNDASKLGVIPAQMGFSGSRHC